MNIVSDVPATLKAGQTVEIKVQHVVTAADVEAESIKNEVTVKIGDLQKTGDDTVETEPTEIEITAASASKVYDGKALTKDGYELTGGALAAGDKIDSVKVNGSQTLVGSSANKASDAVIKNAAGEDVTAGYAITYVDGTLKVTDGTDPEEEDVPNDKVVTKTDNNSGKTYHVGDTVTWTIWVKNIYDETKTVTVTDKLEGVTLTGYTEGQELGAGEELEITATYVVTAKDVENGEIKNEVTAELGNLNKPGESTVETEPIEITITAASASKVYDGTPLTKDGYELTGGELAAGDKIDSVKVNGSQTLVGSSDNKASDAVIKNAAGEDVTAGYTINYIDGILTVTDGTAPEEEDVPDELVVTKSDNSDKTYKIGEVVAWTITITNIYDEEKTLTVTEAAGMNIVSDVPATLKAGQTVEIKVQHVVTAADVAAKSIKNEVIVKIGDLEKTGDDTVETEPIEITITAASGNKVYDGTALTNSGYALSSGTLAAGDKIDSVKVSGSQTAVGSSANKASDAVIKNAAGEDVTAGYKINYVDGTLTVTEAPVPDVPIIVPDGPTPLPPQPPVNDDTTIDDDPTPRTNPEPPTEEVIDDDPTPKGGTKHWALLNLILSIVTVCLGIAMVISFIVGKKDDDDEEDPEKASEAQDDEKKKARNALKFLGLIPAIGTVILFLLTEDMRAKMIFTDKWTILTAVITVIGVALIILIKNKKKEQKEETPSGEEI